MKDLNDISTLFTIAGDKNQFAEGTHKASNERKHRYIREHAELIQLPLPVADYILVDDKVREVIKRKSDRGIPVRKMDLLGSYHFAVDTKKSLVEVAGCLCNAKNHARIKDDLILAKKNGIHIVWLIENTENVFCLDDLFKKGQALVSEYGWKKTKYGEKWLPIHKSRVKCCVLAKTLYTMEHNKEDYDIEFMFCKPQDAGKRIIELLTNERKMDE